MVEGKNFEDKYIFDDEEEEAFGSTSIVRKVINKFNGEFYAVKMIDASVVKKDDIEKEISLLSSMTHENIVQVYEYFIIEPYYLIIFEWMGGGEVSITILFLVI